jgi:hypothetical protein
MYGFLKMSELEEILCTLEETEPAYTVNGKHSINRPL